MNNLIRKIKKDIIKYNPITRRNLDSVKELQKLIRRLEKLDKLEKSE